MIDITDIAKVLLTLAVMAVTGILIPYIRAKFGNEKLGTIKAWVKVGVQAAEMIYKMSGMGKEKKAYVVKFLESKGFALDTDELDNLIESAVLGLKQE